MTMADAVDDFLAWHFETRPVDASFVGISGHDHSLPRADAAAITDEKRALAAHAAALANGPDDIDHRIARAEVAFARAKLDQRPHLLDPAWVTGEGLFAIVALLLPQSAPIDGDAVRARLEALPTEVLRGDLEHHDPVAAARIHPNDRRRTVRALEVWMTTGRRISELQRQWNDAPRELPAGWAVVGLEWPVDLINERINRRVRAMVEAGLEREVMALVAKGPLNRQAIEAVGYREVLRHFAHEIPIEQAEEDIKVRTRQYARQQRTWLRRFKAIPGAIWVDGPRASTAEAASAVIDTLFGPR